MKKCGGVKVTIVMINCEIVKFMERMIYRNSDEFSLSEIKEKIISAIYEKG
jgi:predicted DNA-binding antitoxin AbrB/MazE fold protein